MGWSLGRIGTAIATGGSSELINEVSGGGLYGGGSTYVNKSGTSNDPNAGMAQNNANTLAQAKQSGLDKQKKFY